MTKIKSVVIPLSSVALAGCAVQAQNPNIIYVFPDQFRNQAMAFWNESEYSSHVGWAADPVQTPRLDAFADESVVLSRAMSNCPLSSPYRGIFLTGMYPERSGITLNCMAERPESSLREDAVCISDVLNAQGYSCGFIGKLYGILVRFGGNVCKHLDLIDKIERRAAAETDTDLYVAVIYGSIESESCGVYVLISGGNEGGGTETLPVFVIVGAAEAYGARKTDAVGIQLKRADGEGDKTLAVLAEIYNILTV